MVTPGQMQMFNKPEPYEAQLLGPHHKSQYEYTASDEIPGSGTYLLRLQDHTLGNALRMELLRDQDVFFAGYRVPHPLFSEMEVRLRTSLRSSPQKAMLGCNRRLIESAEHMLAVFQDELKEHRMEEGLLPALREEDEKMAMLED